MSYLKQYLIRLGNQYPDLRPHLRAVLASFQKKATIFERGQKIRVFEDGRRVYFKFPYNERIKDGLKNRGANWDNDRRMWWVGKTKRNLDQVVNYFKQEIQADYGQSAGGFPNTLFEALEGDIQIVETFGKVKFKFPYHKELKNKLKRLGARWNPSDKVWSFSKGDKDLDKAIDLMKEYAQGIAEDQKAKDALRAETKRRKSKNLGVSIPYEHRGLAKDRDGIWDKNTKQWLMPDQQSKTEVLDEVRRRKKEIREQKMQEKKQKVLKRLERDIDASDLETVSFSGRSRADKPSVGQTYQKDGEIVEVVHVGSGESVVDGRSFGYDFDDGYKWTAYVAPASAEDQQKAREQQQKKRQRTQAKNRRSEIVTMVQEQGNKPDGNHSIDADRLAVSGRRDIAYGGGSWFYIEGTQWIWYVRNNGADGDTWAINNVQTGGAGAVGYRMPYDADLADEILDLDEILSD